MSIRCYKPICKIWLSLWLFFYIGFLWNKHPIMAIASCATYMTFAMAVPRMLGHDRWLRYNQAASAAYRRIA